jgi:lyso-ornithine lipid O-acyltransferase
VRAAVRSILLLLLFAVLGPIHVVTKLLFGSSGWPKRFLAAAAWVVCARPTIRGEPVKDHTLLISNHVSWLDILVLGGTTGTAFVSKDNLGHGVIHWLADQNHTLYIRREDRKGSKDQAIAIARAAERDQPITLFPEGTTGPGDDLLPFRSSLLEAAFHASDDVAIRPLALDYGAAAGEVGWHGESGKDNVLRILGRKGTLPVTVHLLPALDRTSDRKALAQAAREAIAETLASSRSAAPLYPDPR